MKKKCDRVTEIQLLSEEANKLLLRTNSKLSADEKKNFTDTLKQLNDEFNKSVNGILYPLIKLRSKNINKSEGSQLMDKITKLEIILTKTLKLCEHIKSLV